MKIVGLLAAYRLFAAVVLAMLWLLVGKSDSYGDGLSTTLYRQQERERE